MSKIGIHPAGSKTYAPYTPAVVVGNHVWLSGQINIDAGDDIVSQTQGTLAKIDGLLAEAGTSCLLYTSPSPRDRSISRMPSSA